MSANAEFYIPPQRLAADIEQIAEAKLATLHGLGQLAMGVGRGMDDMRPAIRLAVQAHDGINGLDKKPLALHCADVMASPNLTTVPKMQLGILHDAATPGWSKLTQAEFVAEARRRRIPNNVAQAALYFARPRDWSYDHWTSFMRRDELTRDVKMTDSAEAVRSFPPQSENQFNSWQGTHDKLAANAPETPAETAAIKAELLRHPLPSLSDFDNYQQAA